MGQRVYMISKLNKLRKRSESESEKGKDLNINS